MSEYVADRLRQRFRLIPRDTRDQHQDYAIRVWRAISWLERAEGIANDDVEGRYIACWIGFNALYGQLDRTHKPWGDREAQKAYLTRIYYLDTKRRFAGIIDRRQKAILSIIDNKYLHEAFWLDKPAAAKELQAVAKESILLLHQYHQLKLWRVIVERLYMMRNQVFHGASTKGSSLNRRALNNCTNIVSDFLPACIDIMLDYGVTEDWGKVCYPPK